MEKGYDSVDNTFWEAWMYMFMCTSLYPYSKSQDVRILF